jgi:hypothetical protein
MVDATLIRVPTTDQILAGLIAISNRALPVAIAWHIVLVAAALALATGWRPAQRTARVLVALPLASVAALGLVFRNPFNGVVFSVAAVVLVLLALRAPTGPVSAAGTRASTIGLATIAFGWVYPHFLDGNPREYLYAAPVGLVPCPTLAIAIGFALLGDGLGARAWTLVLATLGLFYGIFGVVKLGVYLDLGLVLGATALLMVEAKAMGRRRVATAPPRLQV